MRIMIALISGISVTVGQSLLLHILFSAFMATHGFWILLSLLLLNCGATGIVLWFH